MLKRVPVRSNIAKHNKKGVDWNPVVSVYGAASYVQKGQVQQMVIHSKRFDCSQRVVSDGTTMCVKA